MSVWALAGCSWGKKPQSCLVSWHDVACYAGNQVSHVEDKSVTESWGSKHYHIFAFCSPKERRALGNEFPSSCTWNPLVVTFWEWKGSISWCEDALARACLSVQSREIPCSLSYPNPDWYNIEMPELHFQFFCQDQKKFGVTALGSV